MPIVSLNQWNGNYNLQKKIVLNFSTPLKSRKIRCLPAGDFSSGLIVVLPSTEGILLLNADDMTEQELQQYYNEVSNITARCLSNKCWARGEYPELEIGKLYHVSHIGVLSSSTNIMLSEFPIREYNSYCFELYENGELLRNKERLCESV